MQAEDAFESSDLGHRRRERGLDGVARPGKADLGVRAQSRAAPAPGLAPGGWQHDPARFPLVVRGLDRLVSELLEAPVTRERLFTARTRENSSTTPRGRHSAVRAITCAVQHVRYVSLATLRAARTVPDASHSDTSE